MEKVVVSFLIGLSFIAQVTFAQTPIPLTNQTTKVGGLSEEFIYLGFKAGDEIVLTFEEKRKKGLKELEIKEYKSGRALFSEYEIESINQKRISVPSTGIYQFRFYNSALGKRIGKIKIERIPAEEDDSFSSTVYWKTVYDTTYTAETEKFLKSSDTAIVNLTKKVVKVNSLTNQNGNEQYFNFTLPKNTIKWSYYIGVGQKSQEAMEQATKELSKHASSLMVQVSGYGPLASLALGGTSFITQLQKGEDVKYYLVNGENLNLLRSGQSFHAIAKGKIINDFNSFDINNVEPLYFYLINDNAITGITVNVEITAITKTDNWQTRTIQIPKVATSQVPYLKQ